MNRTVFLVRSVGALSVLLVAAAACGGCGSGSRTPNAAPRITSSPITTAMVGRAYRYEIERTGDPLPVGLNVEGLPAWLSLVDGALVGTPGPDHVGLSERILITVSNGTEPDARQSYRIAVSPDGPLLTLAPRATPGRLVPPAGLVASDFTVVSAFGQSAVAADGSFAVPTTGRAQLVWATRGGRTQLLSVLGAPALGGQVSARTTAATLAFLNAGAGTTPAARWDEALTLALADASTSALQQAVQANAVAGGDALASGALRTALGASGQALAGALNRRADAATAPVVSGTDIEQVHRVTPALPRSGVIVDTGRRRLRNDRRRTVFAAVHLAGRTPALADFEAVGAASPGDESLDRVWKGFRNEGGVSSFAPRTDLLVPFDQAYEVTFVGSSLRQSLWPAEGTTERTLLRRALTTDAGRHHLEALSLALGFDARDLRGGLEMLVRAAADQGVAGGLALDLTVASTAEPGLWTLVDGYARSVAQEPALGQPQGTLLRELVGGLDDAALGRARGIVGSLGALQRDLNAKDSPALLYQTASDPKVTFQVDPTRRGNNNGLTIVLEWGETPGDLDSHLLGPDGLHLYYPHAETSGGSPQPGHVSLDLDDTDAFGPETTALLEPRTAKYRFAVYDFTNGADPQAAAIAASGATVKVYQGSNPVPLATFQAPNQRGNAWLVFDYDGRTGVITPLNQCAAVANDLSIPAP